MAHALCGLGRSVYRSLFWTCQKVQIFTLAQDFAASHVPLVTLPSVTCSFTSSCHLRRCVMHVACAAPFMTPRMCCTNIMRWSECAAMVTLGRDWPRC